MRMLTHCSWRAFLVGGMLFAIASAASRGTEGSSSNRVPPAVEDSAPPRPNVQQLGDICGFVGAYVRTSGPEAIGFTYSYYRSFAYAAAVDGLHDTDEICRKKIQHLWHVHYANIICDNTQFDVTNGALIKFAVCSRMDAFIDDFIQTWRAPLNMVDASDEKTVLDYIRDEQKTYAGTALEPKLKRYYTLFRKAGARHKEELKPNEPNDPPDPYEVDITPLRMAWESVCYFSEDLAAVKQHGKWGYVDRQHQIRIQPEYDGAFGFSEGRAAVVKDGKWGYVDASGHLVVNCIYEDAQPFRRGLAAVKNSGRWGYIDKDGNTRVAPQFERAFSFMFELAAIQQNGKWGFIAGTGAMVVPPIYPWLRGAFEPFRPGKSGCEVSEDGEYWRCVLSDGELVAGHR